MLDSLVMPHDLPACQALLAEQVKALVAHELTITTHELTITSLSQRLEELQQENAEQKLTINELMRRAYEKRSERYLEDPNQLKIDFGNTPEAADAAAGLAEAIAQAEAANEIVVPEHTRRKHATRKPRNEQLPAHLPRYEVQAPVPDAAQHCPTHGAKKQFDCDRLETLEFERRAPPARMPVVG